MIEILQFSNCIAKEIFKTLDSNYLDTTDICRNHATYECPIDIKALWNDPKRNRKRLIKSCEISRTTQQLLLFTTKMRKN